MAKRFIINSLYFGSLLFKPTFHPPKDTLQPQPPEVIAVTQDLQFGDCRCPTPGENLRWAQHNMCTYQNRDLMNPLYHYRLAKLEWALGFILGDYKVRIGLPCFINTQCGEEEKICEYNNIKIGAGHMRHFPRYRTVEPKYGHTDLQRDTHNLAKNNSAPPMSEQGKPPSQQIKTSQFSDPISGTGDRRNATIAIEEEVHTSPQESVLYSRSGASLDSITSPSMPSLLNPNLQKRAAH